MVVLNHQIPNGFCLSKINRRTNVFITYLRLIISNKLKSLQYMNMLVYEYNNIGLVKMIEYKKHPSPLTSVNPVDQTLNNCLVYTIYAL